MGGGCTAPTASARLGPPKANAARGELATKSPGFTAPRRPMAPTAVSASPSWPTVPRAVAMGSAACSALPARATPAAPAGRASERTATPTGSSAGTGGCRSTTTSASATPTAGIGVCTCARCQRRPARRVGPTTCAPADEPARPRASARRDVESSGVGPSKHATTRQTSAARWSHARQLRSRAQGSSGGSYEGLGQNAGRGWGRPKSPESLCAATSGAAWGRPKSPDSLCAATRASDASRRHSAASRTRVTARGR